MSLPAITFLLYVIARPSQGGRGNLSVPIRTYDYAEIASSLRFHIINDTVSLRTNEHAEIATLRSQ